MELSAVHTATLLQDGSVLVAGTYRGEPLSGYAPAADQPTAELYDPATGIFTPTGSMIEVSHPHTATLLQDGRVLIAGGWQGSQGSDAIASAELFH